MDKRANRSVNAAGRRDRARSRAMLATLMHFRVVVRTMRDHYRRVEHACGVGGAHVWALAEIAGDPGVTVTDLAHRLALHQSTASNMIDKLQRAGLIVRVRAPPDRRVVRLQATARGRRIVARAPKPVEGALQHALTELSPAKLEALRDSLATLLRAMHASLAGAESLVLGDVIGADRRRRAPRRRSRRTG